MGRPHRPALVLAGLGVMCLAVVGVGIVELRQPDAAGGPQSSTPGLFSGRGVTFRFPADWWGGPPLDQFGGGVVSAGMTQTVAYASDRPFQPACKSTRRELDCEGPSMRGRAVLAAWISGLVDGRVLPRSTPMAGGPHNARWYEGPPLARDCSGATAYEMVMTIVQSRSGDEVMGVQMRACLRNRDDRVEGHVRDMAKSVELG